MSIANKYHMILNVSCFHFLFMAFLAIIYNKETRYTRAPFPPPILHWSDRKHAHKFLLPLMSPRGRKYTNLELSVFLYPRVKLPRSSRQSRNIKVLWYVYELMQLLQILIKLLALKSVKNLHVSASSIILWYPAYTWWII